MRYSPILCAWLSWTIINIIIGALKRCNRVNEVHSYGIVGRKQWSLYWTVTIPRFLLGPQVAATSRPGTVRASLSGRIICSFRRAGWSLRWSFGILQGRASRRLSGSLVRGPIHLGGIVGTLEGSLEDAQFTLAGCCDFLLVLAPDVDDHFLFLCCFCVLNCYFQVFSKHLRGVLL